MSRSPHFRLSALALLTLVLILVASTDPAPALQKAGAGKQTVILGAQTIDKLPGGEQYLITGSDGRRLKLDLADVSDITRGSGRHRYSVTITISEAKAIKGASDYLVTTASGDRLQVAGQDLLSPPPATSDSTRPARGPERLRSVGTARPARSIPDSQRTDRNVKPDARERLRPTPNRRTPIPNVPEPRRPVTGGPRRPDLEDQVLNLMRWSSGPEGTYPVPNSSRFRKLVYKVTGGSGRIEFTIDSLYDQFTTERPSELADPTGTVRRAKTPLEQSVHFLELRSPERFAVRDVGDADQPAPKISTFVVYYDRRRSGNDDDTLNVTVRDSSERTLQKQLRVVSTRATGKPQVHRLYAGEEDRLANPNLTYGVNAWEDHRFGHFYITTEDWSAQDPGSEIVVEYADGFKYALPVEVHRSFTIANGGQRTTWVGEYSRFAKAEAVTLTIKNLYGSETREGLMWNGVFAEFPSGPLSPALMDERARRGSYDYGRRYVLEAHGGLGGSGVDTHHFYPFDSEYIEGFWLYDGPGIDDQKGGHPEGLRCGEKGRLYLGAQVMVLTEVAGINIGSATIRSQPEVGELLSEGDTVRVDWSAVPGRTLRYQLHVRFLPVDGVCQDLVRTRSGGPRAY